MVRRVRDHDGEERENWVEKVRDQDEVRELGWKRDQDGNWIL